MKVDATPTTTSPDIGSDARNPKQRLHHVPKRYSDSPTTRAMTHEA
jgi:hypothetical protein